MISYVDFWPKILLFRTHHLWNFTTELILIHIPYPDTFSNLNDLVHHIGWLSFHGQKSLLLNKPIQRKAFFRNKWTNELIGHSHSTFSLMYPTFRKLKYLDGAPMVDNFRHPQPINNRMIKRVLRELKEPSPTWSRIQKN